MNQSGSTASRVPNAAALASRTQVLLRRQLWIWPLLAAATLAFVGVRVRAQMEEAMRAEIAGHLVTIRDANVEALRAWAATMKSQAELLAGDEEVRFHIQGLLRRAAQQGASPSVLAGTPEFAALRAHLKPAEEGRGFNGYAVLDTNLVVVAAAREQFIGTQSPPGYKELLAACLAGNAIVTPPFATAGMLPDETGTLRATVAMMFAAVEYELMVIPPPLPSPRRERASCPAR